MEPFYITKITKIFKINLQYFTSWKGTKAVQWTGQRFFAVLVMSLIVVALWSSWKSPLACVLRSQKPIFGLLVGTDWVDHAQHSDTIILACYRPEKRTLDLLSIPRDTRINLPDLKIKRINQVYAFAYRNKKNHDLAVQELSKAVQWVLFSNNKQLQEGTTVAAPIEKMFNLSFYVQINYDGFKKMIDLLGGVPITIDEPMNYDDNWGKLHIHFEPGETVLNGQKALEYVRFRNQSGDYGRTARQQEFFLKAINQLKYPVNILRFPKMAWAGATSIKTNLSWFELFLILWEAKDLPVNQIRLLQLPGKSSKEGYWIPEWDGVNATMDLLVRGEIVPKLNDNALTVSGELAENNSQEPPVRLDIPPATTVEVWNASSKTGLALQVVRKLRDSGFDVVKWGNYESRQQRTFVRDHRGNAQQSRAIASVLSSPRVEVFTRIESNPLVDVEVILGEDYQVEK